MIVRKNNKLSKSRKCSNNSKKRWSDKRNFKPNDRGNKSVRNFNKAWSKCSRDESSANSQSSSSPFSTSALKACTCPLI